MHTQGHIHVHILYMQVFDRCHTVTKLVCVLCSCMHTHGLRHVQCTYRHIHSLRAGSGWVSHSDRHSWCPVGICIHVFTVCTVQLYTHIMIVSLCENV